MLLVDADPQGDLTTALGWTEADNLYVTLTTQMERVVLGFYLVNDILEREAQIREDKLFCERMKNETMMYHQISENYNKRVISDRGTLIMES